MEPTTTTKEARAERKPTRTCAGCMQRVRMDAPDALVRVVLGPRDAESDARTIASDLAGSAFGRGAHVHPKTDCIRKASSGGLARAFKCAVKISAPELARQIAQGCERRFEGLLMGARRAGYVAVGEEGRDALMKGAFAIVAFDAGSVASKGPVAQAVAEGRAVAWKKKTSLGALLGRDEVAVAALKNAAIAEQVRRVREIADSVSSLAGQ